MVRRYSFVWTEISSQTKVEKIHEMKWPRLITVPLTLIMHDLCWEEERNDNNANFEYNDLHQIYHQAIPPNEW